MATLNTYICLGNAIDEAAKFYTAVVPGSRIIDIVRKPGGEALVANLELAGRAVTLVSGRPSDCCTNGVSFQLMVDSQEEIDLV